jgi:serine protease
VPSPGAKDLLPHLALVPGERVQGPVDTCWVWAATAVTEIALDVQEGIRDRLSVEYFDASYRGGRGEGWAGDRGWISDYASQVRANPVLVPWSNPNASYRDGTRWCLEQHRAAVEASAIATEPHYTVARCESRRIPTWRTGTGAAVANVRAELDAERAVFVGFTLPNATARQAFREFWANGNETDVWDPSPWLTADGERAAFSHAVACVGYDTRDPGNRYWVMLNSWGTAEGRRPLGTFRMRMDLDYDLPVYRDDPDGPAMAFESLAIAFADPVPRTGSAA